MSLPMQPIINVDRAAVKAGIAAGTLTLVDVRERHEFAAGHIPGSINMPLSGFDADALADLGPHIVFSCAAGIRSQHAIRMAEAEGLNIHEHYAGGFKDWIMSGEDVARHD